MVVFRFREKAKVDPGRLVQLVRERGDLQLVPPVSLKLDLKKAAEPAEPMTLKARHQASRRRPRAEPAWWTARATAGEVTAGFSKAEILKPKAEDPRAPGGILEKVTELLEDLGDAP